MNQVDVSREKALQGFAAIAADNDFDINEILGEEEQIEVDDKRTVDDVEMPATKEILFEAGMELAPELAPNLALQEDEIRKLANVWGPLIDKYFPGGWLAFLDHFKLEIAAGFTTYMVFAPRLRAYKKHLAEQASVVQTQEQESPAEQPSDYDHEAHPHAA